jgi:ribosomal protein L11 methyltransferase
MRYLELTVSVEPEAVEAAADLLRRYARAGVSIEPPYRALDEEGGYEIDARAPVRLRAWLPAGREARANVTALRGELRAIDSIASPLRARAVDDASWADAWKRYFRTLCIGRSIVIKPSWRKYRAHRGDVVIELDPGMAFGTGQHATTQLCLEALEQHITSGAIVLDVGSGSGILSIAAALLGAKHVDAIDIDLAAVRATKENATRNGVERVVRVRRGSLGDAWPFRFEADGRYDIILANLSSRLVQELAEPLVAALRPGDVALVSGIIDAREAACRSALRRAGGRVIESKGWEGWRLLSVERATVRRQSASSTRGRRSRRAR